MRIKPKHWNRLSTEEKLLRIYFFIPKHLQVIHRNAIINTVLKQHLVKNNRR